MKNRFQQKKGIACIGISLFVLLMALSCKRSAPSETGGATEQEEGITAVLLSPAGSAESWEWDAANGEYRQGPVLDFLPYPANFGYLASTMQEGGARPLEVLLIGERIEKREAGIQPIGLLRYTAAGGDKGALLIAIPSRESLRTIRALTFRQFLIEYDAAKRIVETWFLHHRGYGSVGLIGWEDEQAALREIRARSEKN